MINIVFILIIVNTIIYFKYNNYIGQSGDDGQVEPPFLKSSPLSLLVTPLPRLAFVVLPGERRTSTISLGIRRRALAG
jgi:hypothetical protein